MTAEWQIFKHKSTSSRWINSFLLVGLYFKKSKTKTQNETKQYMLSLPSAGEGKSETQAHWVLSWFEGMCWQFSQRRLSGLDAAIIITSTLSFMSSWMFSEIQTSKDGIFKGTRKSLKTCSSFRCFWKASPNRFTGLFLKMPSLLHRFDYGPKLIICGPLKIQKYPDPDWPNLHKALRRLWKQSA